MHQRITVCAIRARERIAAAAIEVGVGALAFDELGRAESVSRWTLFARHPDSGSRCWKIAWTRLEVVGVVLWARVRPSKVSCREACAGQ